MITSPQATTSIPKIFGSLSFAIGAYLASGQGSSSESETLRPSKFFPPSSQNLGAGWQA